MACGGVFSLRKSPVGVSRFPLQLCQLAAAAAADILIVIGRQLFLGAAENAAGEVLFKNDLIAVHIDFNITVDIDAEGAAQLDGENDAPEVVNFSYDAGGFHDTFPP